MEAKTKENGLALLTKPQITKKLDVTKKYIDDMKKQAASLTIKDLDDKQGYDNVNTALQTVKKKRIAVTKKEKELKEPYQKVIKEIGDISKGIVAELKPIELDLGTKRKDIDDLIEARREEKRLAKAKLFEERILKLGQLQFVKSNGTMYYCENASVEVHNISVLSEEQFEKAYQELKAESDVLEAFRLKKEEEDRVVKEAKDKQDEKDRLELKDLRKEKKEREKQEALKKTESGEEKRPTNSGSFGFKSPKTEPEIHIEFFYSESSKVVAFSNVIKKNLNKKEITALKKLI